jgi:putative toxin-antitoxin system antitoxin component (TIGR02293 family)
MPATSSGEKGGSITKWLKKEGDRVKAGDVVAEIEMDTATLEVETRHDGILGKILIPEGTADVPVHAPIVTILDGSEAASSESSTIDCAFRLLGGRETLHQGLASRLDAHEMLLSGLPWSALSHLSRQLVLLGKDGLLETAIGISPRTFQRNQAEPGRRLSLEQSGRTWKFAEILSRAIAIFGSQEDAENRLRQNSIALEQRRPIDLLQSPAGVELVEQHLTRLEYGVYA